ncbi:MAG: hypothetical protein P4L16_06620 [Chlamydiales bacterium]|nr:hypothetical protein [Chlamydiales bacterium]
MSKNAQEFLNKISKNEQLRMKVLDLYQKGLKKQLEKIAADNGCPCTFEELKAVYKGPKNEVTKLDDKLLKSTSGGAPKPGGMNTDTI